VSDLDQLVRDGLRDSVNRIPARDAGSLADQIGSGLRRRRRRSVRRRALAAACVAAVVALLGTVVLPGRSDEARVVVTPPLEPVSGFAQLGPGWHELARGPVPDDLRVSAGAWTGSELVVMGSRPDGTGAAFAYEPVADRWRILPPPPVDVRSGVGLAWTGSELVAVDHQFPVAAAAAWNPTGGTWRSIGSPPLAGPLQTAVQQAVEMGLTGPFVGISAGRSARGSGEPGTALVWTGQRLLDFSHGAAWDPATGAWTEMPSFPNLYSRSDLLPVVPVWDGTEVILAPWGTNGMAWDATGSTYRQLPGLPVELERVRGDFLTTLVGDRILLVGGLEGPGQDGLAVSVDPRRGTWRQEPTIPGTGDMLTGVSCPTLLAAVSGQAVVAPCDGRTPMVLGDGGWTDIAPEPGVGRNCCYRLWIEAGGSLVTWGWTSTNAESGVRANVWVPPDL
jgi:hypothetical protein